MNSYGQTYGYGEVLNGPSNYADITDFVNGNFGTTGATFSPHIIVQSVDYYPVLGIISTSNPFVNHAVILQSYKDGIFSYYDPTSGKYDSIPASSVIYGIGIKGCK
ncbi:MAG TPA: hypothetical protein GXX42_01990 [Petrimonas sp.]|uniref:hypothetical protein n=1 Tax=Petrimonas sp. TaxID=2023866 RepID=UPI00176FAF4E|nr:hypothetical protein [Petrimonas sp.]